MGDLVWKILIVDDEHEIHTITKLVMTKEEVLGRRLEFFDAFSAEEAQEILTREPDIALVLLDVVMKSSDDGLELTRWIREVLKNKFIRIVLRTGNPGEAPEIQVITGYDINDYKEKSELTAKKLRTLFFTSFRNYRELLMLEKGRQGLMRVVSSMADLFIYSSLEKFIGGVLEQIDSYLFLDRGALYGVGAIKGLADGDYRIVAATGEYSQYRGRNLSTVLESKTKALISENQKEGDYFLKDDIFIHRTPISCDRSSLLILEGIQNLSSEDKGLLNVFVENVSAAFKNIAERKILA